MSAIERAHPEQRVVAVQMPGGLPRAGWNVPNNLYRGNVPLDSAHVPDMREGLYGAFLVADGPFRVRLNTGETID